MPQRLHELHRAEKNFTNSSLASSKEDLDNWVTNLETLRAEMDLDNWITNLESFCVKMDAVIISSKMTDLDFIIHVLSQ